RHIPRPPIATLFPYTTLFRSEPTRLSASRFERDVATVTPLELGGSTGESPTTFSPSRLVDPLFTHSEDPHPPLGLQNARRDSNPQPEQPGTGNVPAVYTSSTTSILCSRLDLNQHEVLPSLGPQPSVSTIPPREQKCE